MTGRDGLSDARSRSRALAPGCPPTGSRLRSFAINDLLGLEADLPTSGGAWAKIQQRRSSGGNRVGTGTGARTLRLLPCSRGSPAGPGAPLRLRGAAPFRCRRRSCALPAPRRPAASAICRTRACCRPGPGPPRRLRSAASSAARASPRRMGTVHLKKRMTRRCPLSWAKGRSGGTGRFSLPINSKNWRRPLVRPTTLTCTLGKCWLRKQSSRKTEYRSGSRTGGPSGVSERSAGVAAV
ncbi:visual system homeobox 1 homolog (zebrafish) [Mus musculus]|nr:visual system homeobox 1 homolog (zebrafish) [Mus musculus]